MHNETVTKIEMEFLTNCIPKKLGIFADDQKSTCSKKLR